MKAPPPSIDIPPAVMSAAQTLEKALDAALGGGTRFALVIGNVRDGQVHIRRLTNAGADTAQKLYELACRVPLPADSIHVASH